MRDGAVEGLWAGSRRPAARDRGAAAAALPDRLGRTWYVRDLAAGDGGLLADYFERLSAADYANFHPHALDRPAALHLAGQAGSGQDWRCLLLADPEADGGAAGYGFLMDWQAAEPTLGMSLAPAARGRGLATAFTRHLVEGAAAAGRAAVRLTVYRDNVPAYRAYVAAGFREVASGPEDWGGRVREEVHMRCPLCGQR